MLKMILMITIMMIHQVMMIVLMVQIDMKNSGIILQRIWEFLKLVHLDSWDVIKVRMKLILNILKLTLQVVQQEPMLI